MSSGDQTKSFSFTHIVKDYTFAAYQKLGSSATPADYFSGTAQPGSIVEVESAYGYGKVTVAKSGEWGLWVEFPDAPIGKAFGVNVWNSEGHSVNFTFTRLGGEI